tara:strand:+ start:3924 stop:4064 length:141 start_codon:yes stop_codon:yes gene_type:complete
MCDEVTNPVGFFNMPADNETALLPRVLKKILAPHSLQKPLLALTED